MHEKYQAGQAYSPDNFVDRAGYIRAVEELEQRFQEYVAEERSD